jgi:hypothetical protein
MSSHAGSQQAEQQIMDGPTPLDQGYDEVDDERDSNDELQRRKSCPEEQLSLGFSPLN